MTSQDTRMQQTDVQQTDVQQTDVQQTDTSPRQGVGLWAVLSCKDAPAMIRFLDEGLGFTVAAVYEGEPGSGTDVAHAELRWPAGGGVMLGSTRPADAGDPFSATGPACVYLLTDEPDALFQRAVAAGATVVSEPVDKDYGARDFVVRDAEGNLWSAGTYRGEG
jgi:uncharacterized glyoxalase superfamily protein PhnB